MENELKARVKPFIKQLSARLISEFEAKGIIEKLSGGESNYRVVRDSFSNETISDTDGNVRDLEEMRKILELLESDLQTNNLNISEPLTESTSLPRSLRRKEGALKELIQRIRNAKGNQLENIQEFAKSKNLPFSSLPSNLVETYGRTKCLDYFSDLDYSSSSELSLDDSSFDLALKSKDARRPKLYFEFKWRKSNPRPNREQLIRFISRVRTLSFEDQQTSYFLYIVFTGNEGDSFNRAKETFEKIVDEIAEPHLREGIRFVPISIINLSQIQNSLRDFTKEFIEDDFKFTFETQEPPLDFPDRNDHFYNELFIIKDIEYDIKIQPVMSNYWRFGIELLKSNQTPPITSGRHGIPDVGSIHIAVGDQTKSLEWTNSNRLYLTKYHIELLQDNFQDLTTYRGEPVQMSLRKIEEGAISISISTDGTDRGMRLYDIADYKYFRIYAWCDRHPFKLDTTVNITKLPLSRNIESEGDNSKPLLRLVTTTYSPNSFTVSLINDGSEATVTNVDLEGNVLFQTDELPIILPNRGRMRLAGNTFIGGLSHGQFAEFTIRLTLIDNQSKKYKVTILRMGQKTTIQNNEVSR